MFANWIVISLFNLACLPNDGFECDSPHSAPSLQFIGGTSQPLQVATNLVLISRLSDPDRSLPLRESETLKSDTKVATMLSKSDPSALGTAMRIYYEVEVARAKEAHDKSSRKPWRDARDVLDTRAVADLRMKLLTLNLFLFESERWKEVKSKTSIGAENWPYILDDSWADPLAFYGLMHGRDLSPIEQYENWSKTVRRRVH